MLHREASTRGLQAGCCCSTRWRHHRIDAIQRSTDGMDGKLSSLFGSWIIFDIFCEFHDGWKSLVSTGSNCLQHFFLKCITFQSIRTDGFFVLIWGTTYCISPGVNRGTSLQFSLGPNLDGLSDSKSKQTILHLPKVYVQKKLKTVPGFGHSPSSRASFDTMQHVQQQLRPRHPVRWRIKQTGWFDWEN